MRRSQRDFVARLAGAALLSLLSDCVLPRQRGSLDEPSEGIRTCRTPVASRIWAWKSVTLNSVRAEIPALFIERLGVDPRSRTWEYGPRVITFTLTTDPHIERDVPFFSGRCEITLGERSVEVVSSTTGDNDRAITARVPNVEGGFDLIIAIATRYPEEIDVLRRVITSVSVADSARR